MHKTFVSIASCILSRNSSVSRMAFCLQACVREEIKTWVVNKFSLLRRIFSLFDSEKSNELFKSVNIGYRILRPGCTTSYMSTFIWWQHERYDYTFGEYIGEWYGLFIACITAGDIYFHSSTQPLRHALQEPWKDGYFTLRFIGLYPRGFSAWRHACSWCAVHILLFPILVIFQRAALFQLVFGVWLFLKMKCDFLHLKKQWL